MSPKPARLMFRPGAISPVSLVDGGWTETILLDEEEIKGEGLRFRHGGRDFWVPLAALSCLEWLEPEE